MVLLMLNDNPHTTDAYDPNTTDIYVPHTTHVYESPADSNTIHFTENDPRMYGIASTGITYNFAIESHQGSTDGDPSYVAILNTSGDVVAMYLDSYVQDFLLLCKDTSDKANTNHDMRLFSHGISGDDYSLAVETISTHINGPGIDTPIPSGTAPVEGPELTQNTTGSSVVGEFLSALAKFIGITPTESSGHAIETASNNITNLDGVLDGNLDIDFATGHVLDTDENVHPSDVVVESSAEHDEVELTVKVETIAEPVDTTTEQHFSKMASHEQVLFDHNAQVGDQLTRDAILETTAQPTDLLAQNDVSNEDVPVSTASQDEMLDMLAVSDPTLVPTEEGSDAHVAPAPLLPDMDKIDLGADAADRGSLVPEFSTTHIADEENTNSEIVQAEKDGVAGTYAQAAAPIETQITVVGDTDPFVVPTEDAQHMAPAVEPEAATQAEHIVVPAVSLDRHPQVEAKAAEPVVEPTQDDPATSNVMALQDAILAQTDAEETAPLAAAEEAVHDASDVAPVSGKEDSAAGSVVPESDVFVPVADVMPQQAESENVPAVQYDIAAAPVLDLEASASDEKLDKEVAQTVAETSHNTADEVEQNKEASSFADDFSIDFGFLTDDEDLEDLKNLL